MRANAKASLKLICFPYAGAATTAFWSWRLRLPENVELCAIQLPGRHDRSLEPPFRRVSHALEEIGKSLLTVLDRPFAFFGHSMGAILSFEISRWLRHHRNLLPEVLFVSGRRAPQIPDTGPTRYLMDDAGFLDEIRKLNATPEEILANAEALKLFLAVLRADTELCETYAYLDDVPLACPIVAFAGMDDIEETSVLMKGWHLQTTRDFTLHQLKGDHFFLRSSEPELLRLLLMELSRRHRPGS